MKKAVVFAWCLLWFLFDKLADSFGKLVDESDMFAGIMLTLGTISFAYLIGLIDISFKF